MVEGIQVFDCYGNPQPWAWLEREYGPIVIWPANPGPGWRVVEIRENRDLINGTATAHMLSIVGGVAAPAAAATLICRALTADGQPAVDLRIAWYWPDAPEDPPAMPVNGLPLGMRLNRAISGYTNLNGHNGFAMGGGAYYDPAKGQIGPHACWVYGANSDVLFGLGMRERSNHDHLDFTFSQTAEEPPAPPIDDELRAKVLEGLHYIQAECTALLELLAK